MREITSLTIRAKVNGIKKDSKMVCLRFLKDLTEWRNTSAIKPDFGKRIPKKLKVIIATPAKMRTQYLTGLCVVNLKITICNIKAVHAVSPWTMASLNIIYSPIRVKSIQLYHTPWKNSIRIASSWQLCKAFHFSSIFLAHKVFFPYSRCIEKIR